MYEPAPRSTLELQLVIKENMLPEWTVVGFSGHRNVEKPAMVREAIRKVLDRLAQAQGHLATISSAASGGDTLFLEEITRRRLPFRLVLPFPRELFEHDFTQADWQRVVPLLNQALFVQEISGTDSKKEAYLETGALTVETADVMIFLWDGKPPAGTGGTGDMVEYARALKKPFVAIEPVSGDIVIEERLDQLPPKSIQTRWEENPRNAVEQHFKELDQAATRQAPRARHLITLIISLHLLALAAGVFAIIFESSHWRWDMLNPGRLEQGIAPVTELVFLLLVVSLVWYHRRLQHGWIQSRVPAELCRSYLATWNLRRRANFFPRMAVSGFEQLARSLRIAWYLDQHASCSFQEARDQYRTNRILDQIIFFKRCCGRAQIASRRLKPIAPGATILAILSAVLALFTLHPLLMHIGSVLLPLVSAAILSVVVSHEYARRGTLYKEMILQLEDYEKRLVAALTWPSLFRVVMETEECLLQEVTEWHSFMRFASDSH